MTISEAIAKVDALKPNTYKPEEKVSWLSTLDWMIKREILDVSAVNPSEDFNGYDCNTPLDTVLIAQAPYDELYIRYLEAQIDYYNGELTRYANSMSMFNSLYNGYTKWYGRNNPPKARKLVFW